MKQLKIFSLFAAFFIGTFLYGAASDPADNPNYRLSTAIYNGDVDAARQALDAGADVNEKPIAPLMLAASQGRVAIAELLLQRGAPVDAPNRFRMTALIEAVNGGHLAVVNLLIDHGANVDVRSVLGMTPLMIAAELGNEALVARLLAAGANLMIRNDENRTAAQLARSAGHANIAAMLENLEALRADEEAFGA
jgi:ankyrin repeat protein